MRNFLTDDDYARAEANGISYRTAYQRFYDYGWTIEDTVTKPVKKRTTRYYAPELLETAAKNGVSRDLLGRRIFRMGWSEEEASTTPPLTQKEMGERSGAKKSKFTPEQVETFEKNGIPRGTVLQRLRYGWGMEEAISHPVLGAGERRDGIERVSIRPFWKSPK